MKKIKKSKINTLIYNATWYNYGKYINYVTISELVDLLNTICDVHQTTEYVSVIPFYNNYKYSGMIELEDYVFYIECRRKVSSSDIDNFPMENIISDNPTEEDIKIARQLIHLCNKNDVDGFIRKIKNYITFLNELIPIMMESAIEISKLYNIEIKTEDLCYGWLEFQIDSE